jgi:hypothetical protein
MIDNHEVFMDEELPEDGKLGCVERCNLSTKLH